MAEEGELHTGYVTYEMSTHDNLPSRYSRQRGGKRRQSTINKQQLQEAKRRSRAEEDEATSDDKKYRISSDDSSVSTVDENLEVDSIASSIEETLTWRGNFQAMLHSPLLHIIVVLLVVADGLIVIFELLLDVGAFGNVLCKGESVLKQMEFCHFSTKGDECAPPAKFILEGQNISASPGTGKGEDGLCDCKFRMGRRICADVDGEEGVNPAFVLHVSSLCILTIFLIEILVKLIAFKMKYFTHKFEVFDGCIVVLSFILDVASLKEEEAFEAASLVIVLRLWRVVRIVNGAILSSKARSDQQFSEARLKARTIVHAFHKAQDKLDDLEEENEKLKQKLQAVKTQGVCIRRGNMPTSPHIIVVDVDKQSNLKDKKNNSQETKFNAMASDSPECNREKHPPNEEPMNTHM